MDDVVVALAEQQAELLTVLAGLAAARWRLPTRCEGWDVADVVLNLAQTNELAIGSATGRFAEVAAELAGDGRAGSIDDGAAMMVERHRGRPMPELMARFTAGVTRLVDLFDTMDLSRRVMWVAGDLSARTLAAPRLAETWIHTGDVAEGVGVTLPAT